MIYVIEDDRGWEDYYRRILREFTLKFFHDGVAAMAEMDTEVPDLVILDILLTGPTGFAVLNEMRSYPELANVPVIIVSSVKMPEEDAVALKQYGIVTSLDKAESIFKGYHSRSVHCGIFSERMTCNTVKCEALALGGFKADDGSSHDSRL